jgi:hypothetical protein
MKCYKKAKVKRRTFRDKGELPATIVDSRFVSTMHYPNRERLEFEADTLKVGQQSKVIGMNHMWDVPKDIDFVKQSELEDSTEVWVMFKVEPMPDMVKQMLGIK